MIPLAQYLSEIDDGRAARPAPAARRRPPAFQRLQVVQAEPEDAPEIEFEPLFAPAAGPIAFASAPFDAAAFGADSEAGEGDMLGGLDLDAAFAAAGEPEAPAEDVTERIDAARAEGLAAGRAAMRAELETEFAAERERIMAAGAAAGAAAVAQARAAWSAGEGERLSSALASGLERIEAVILRSFGSVLAPLARAARERQTIDELVEAVARLAGDGRALSLRAAGPADLLQALKAALPERHAALLVLEEAGGEADLKLQADAATIETRLVEWRRAVSEVLS